MLRPPAADALRTFEVALTLGCLATVTVFLRFVARRRTKTKFLADDYVTVVAWIFMMGLIVNAGIRMSSNPPNYTWMSSDKYEVVFNGGLGHHEIFLSLEEDDLFGKVERQSRPALPSNSNFMMLNRPNLQSN